MYTTIGLGRPGWLCILFALLLLVPAALLAERRRSRRWRAIGQSGSPTRDRWGAWMACLIPLIVALSEPRWMGRPDAEPITGHDVLLLIDVSRSMAAEDAPPSRLASAVDAAWSLVAAIGERAGERVGVVAFDGRGVVRCPLTENLGAVVEALRSLRPGTIRPGGTNLAAGLNAAIDAFDREGPAPSGGRAIALFSDGEDLSGHALEAVPRLLENRVVVHSIALGDEARGHPIPWPRRDGSIGQIQFGGRTVTTTRDDEHLRAIAQMTGGVFVPLGLATVDLGALYRQRIEPSEELTRTVGPRSVEGVARHPPFLLASLLLGVWALWPHRGIAARIARPERIPRIATVLLAAGLLLGADEPAGRATRDGLTAYRRGEFAAAAAAFERAARFEPGSAVSYYNHASATYQLGEFEAAASLYTTAQRLATQTSLRAKIEFGLGNVAVARRDLRVALAHYDACLALLGDRVDSDPLRADAAANRTYAEELLQLEMTAQPESDEPDQAEGAGDATTARSENPKADQAEPDESDPSDDGMGGRPPAVGPRAGGAGGTSARGKADPPATPSDRLQEAVRAIRDARADALVEEDHTNAARGEAVDSRDW